MSAHTGNGRVPECDACNRMIKNGHWYSIPDNYGKNIKTIRIPLVNGVKEIRECEAHRKERYAPLQPAWQK